MFNRRRIWPKWTAFAFCLFALPAQASILGDLVKSGDLAAVTAAVDSGAAINEVDGVSALYIAAEDGKLEIARLLVSRGADVNLPVKFQRTPLHAATKGGHGEIVKLLLDNGANPGQLVQAQAPLHVAADNGCLDCVVHLLDAGADVNVLTSNGSPPIHFAKSNGHLDIVAYLVSHGAMPPVVAPITPRLGSANAASGKEVFDKTCVRCHLATAGAEDSKRSNLWGIVGRQKAGESDVTYSAALREAGGTWTFEDLNAYISHPARTLPGTEMGFPGLEDETQRADLIAYLQTLSETPVPLP